MIALRLTSVLLALSLAVLALARPHARQCQATLDMATTIVNRMQSHYYLAIIFGYVNGELWTDANAIEDVQNWMLATGSTQYNSLADTSKIGLEAALDVGWDTLLGGSYDDAQWLILAYWKIADYKAAHGQDASEYLESAQSIYELVASMWDDTTCGGGVWWSKDKNYKNAITNELFLLTSAQGYQRYNDQTMLDNAKKTWAWLESSGMRNADGLWNDGLVTATCQNNGQTTWTYNQGVIASGLGTLAAITGNTTLLSEAELTLDATIAHMTVNDILKESCDDAVKSSCDKDQEIFKGIWTKHLQYYLDAANDAARSTKYARVLGDQASAVVHYGKAADNDVGSVWYAPSQGGTLLGPQASTSGLAALLASAKYGEC